MKRLFAKMRRIRMTRWNKLTRGEKVMGVVMVLIKWAAIAAVAAVVVGAVLSVIMGVVAVFVISSAIINAITGGLANASHAYRPGDVYVRFR